MPTDPTRRGPRRADVGHAVLRHASLGVPLALVCLAAACAGQLETRHGDRLDVSSYPPDIRAAYEVFAVRCSRCHTLARPFNARITDEEHWVRYVARMRRQPGSGINRKNGETILKFLLFYTAEVRRQEAGDPEPPPPDQSEMDRAEPVVPAPDDAVRPPVQPMDDEPASLQAPASDTAPNSGDDTTPSNDEARTPPPAPAPPASDQGRDL